MNQTPDATVFVKEKYTFWDDYNAACEIKSSLLCLYASGMKLILNNKVFQLLSYSQLYSMN